MTQTQKFSAQPDQAHPLELSIRVSIRDMFRGGGGLDLAWNGYSAPMDFEEAARLMARFHALIQEFKS